ncbi:hypothetical protein ACIQZB_03650 [Streptomyces sp. NPDC097727]|uniref:hypothetical protein n=1 Tax=Streptomyces sp. NPDC097727 TaxID=3366092 RepID=UPI00382EDDA7
MLGGTDGDGYPDIAVGLPGEKIKGIADAGRVLVLKGGVSFGAATLGAPTGPSRFSEFLTD